ncbi:TRAP transporter substrate-binding protein [Reichenbachiella carrageenanivorans]|uniref:TRAP transporter substrate-binding protein n=1 Tax=Reichenbachiella carrageenanivorans TaxID=2979869 RepID=A0ABY6D594_9BACT|nr:TRAP transporter substrate-binding protein [Reichenbachiella carrageenanivorans]UXX81311.1 TRAP transporter substrate-binding protein [Reichenbachiella carrageenanivorans]
MRPNQYKKKTLSGFAQWMGWFGVLLVLSMGCTSRNEKVLFLAHNLPETHPVHKGIQFFQSELSKLSSGTLEVHIFPNSQLGSEREALELLQIGTIAITKVSSAVMANFSPEYKVLGVPYLFRDKQHFFDVLEGEVGQQMLDGSSDYLLRGLCFYDAGSRSFYTKKPVRVPADLEGLKIRVMNHQLSIDMVNNFGGSATPMASGELYTALQQGVVDGAENNAPTFVSSNQFEVCKYFTLDEHTSIPDVMVISTKFWDTLSDQEKKWVTQAAKASAQAQKKYWEESVTACMEILEENQVEVIRPDKTLFYEKSIPLIEEFAKDKDMKIIIDKIKSY